MLSNINIQLKITNTCILAQNIFLKAKYFSALSISS